MKDSLSLCKGNSSLDRVSRCCYGDLDPFEGRSFPRILGTYAGECDSCCGDYLNVNHIIIRGRARTNFRSHLRWKVFLHDEHEYWFGDDATGAGKLFAQRVEKGVGPGFVTPDLPTCDNAEDSIIIIWFRGYPLRQLQALERV
jgi:hypothetical protein